jgi:hypothetical protein
MSSDAAVRRCAQQLKNAMKKNSVAALKLTMKNVSEKLGKLPKHFGPNCNVVPPRS